MQQLPSNVSSLGLSLVSVPTNFQQLHNQPPRAAALLQQLLDLGLTETHCLCSHPS